MHFGPYAHPALQQISGAGSSNSPAGSLPGSPRRHLNQHPGEACVWQGTTLATGSAASAPAAAQMSPASINSWQWAMQSALTRAPQPPPQLVAQAGGQANALGGQDQPSQQIRQQQQQSMYVQQLLVRAMQPQTAFCGFPCVLPAYPCASAPHHILQQMQQE